MPKFTPNNRTIAILASAACLLGPYYAAAGTVTADEAKSQSTVQDGQQISAASKAAVDAKLSASSNNPDVNSAAKSGISGTIGKDGIPDQPAEIKPYVVPGTNKVMK